MQLSNTEITNSEILLDYRKRQTCSQELTAIRAAEGEVEAAAAGCPVKAAAPQPAPSAPAFGNMMFQLCGGMQSALTALQGVIFENEAVLMANGTKLAEENFQEQGLAASQSYNATYESGQDQAANLRLSALQSFVTGGVSIAGAVGQQWSESKSEAAGKLKTLGTKLEGQEKLSEFARPTADSRVGSAAVTTSATLPGTAPIAPATAVAAAAAGGAAAAGAPAPAAGGAAAPAAAAPAVPTAGDLAAITARKQDLLAHGGAHPMKETTYRGETYGKKQEYCAEALDKEVIAAMTPEERARFYEKCEEQIRTTKQEIQTAQSKIDADRQRIQTLMQLGQQATTAGTTMAQVSKTEDQKYQDAVAAMTSQSSNMSNTIAQQAAKMRETAVEEGRNAVAALVQAMNVRA